MTDLNDIPGADPKDRPTVTLNPGGHRRAVAGHPWIFSNEVRMDAAAKALPLGGLVRIVADHGEAIGVATFNPHPLIAARLLSRDADMAIDAAFLGSCLARALALRERLVPAPYYRLIHAEADGLPGAVIDRYGDVLVVQANTAGMTFLLPALLAALDETLRPRAVLIRNDSPVRALEGLERRVEWVKGTVEGPVELIENDVRFVADLAHGQKTGWFFDQRENRALVASLARDARLLDLYAYAGGFAVQSAVAGAAEVVAVDRSAQALEAAETSAALNAVEGRCRFVKGEAFAEAAQLRDAGESFNIVVADPPAFVKSKKELAQGAKGYRKLVRLVAPLVRPEGFLFVASCSYHVDRALFAEMVRRGLADASRSGRILAETGAAMDHPVHPALPESAYLKATLLQLD